jgi:signal transduction histidine kinase
MTPRGQLVAVVGTTVMVAWMALVAARHGPFPPPADAVVVDLFAGSVTAYAGVLLGRWVPPNRTGWLLVAVGWVSLASGLQWAMQPLLFTIGGVVGGAYYAVIVHLLLALPGGRLRTRVDRLFVGSVYALTLLSGIVPNLFYECRSALLTGCPGNLLLVRDDPALVRSTEVVLGSLGLVLLAVVAARLGRRWWRAGAVGRRVLSPPLLASTPLPVLALLDVLRVWDRFGVLANLVRPLMLSLLPVGILLGALRTKARAGEVGGLVAAADPGAGAGIREELEHAIAQALGDPTARLRGPDADPDDRRPDDRRPDDRRPDDRRPDDRHPVGRRPDDHRVDGHRDGQARTPVVVDGQTVAVLAHDPALSVEPGLLDSVLATARLALRNERLAREVERQLAEVQASRSRLALAQDEERRRIERDLHDGAQQRLVSAQLLLRMAVDAGGDPALVQEAAEELARSTEELRALARGVHPSLVSERGLVAAVEMLAERAPLPVSVHGTAPRLAPLVETTAYFVVAESLTNVARHARATHVDIAAGVTDGLLTVSVADDGAGGATLDGAGGDRRGGTGLVGLRDRVEAAGGRLTVSSGPIGTTVRADLPAEAVPAAPVTSAVTPSSPSAGTTP